MIAVIFGLLFSLSLHAESKQTRVGYAHSIENDALLYTEHHYEVFSDSIVRQSRVIYKNVEGRPFAEKTVSFSINDFLPEFSLQNNITGHHESSQFLDDKYAVRFLQTNKKKIREKSLAYSNNAIGDAGFDNFVISHWDELRAGKILNRDFLIPGMLRFFNFRIYQHEIVEEGDKKLRVLYIEPDSFILRAISSPSKLFYDMENPKLRRFLGTSNMRDGRGNNYNVDIRYENTD